MSNSVNLSLDVTKTGIQNPLIKVRQGDGGFETLHTTVTSNGEPMDLQGWTITFMGTTAGNHKIVDANVTIVEAPNGIFDYTPSKAWGMDIGEFQMAYFKFVKGDGSASSANFRVSVIEAVDLTQDEAKNYISVVDATIAGVRQQLTNSLASVNTSIAATSTAASSMAVYVSSTANSAVNKVNTTASSAVNTINTTASSAVSQVTSVASNASSVASNAVDKLNSLSIGVRNYILNSLCLGSTNSNMPVLIGATADNRALITPSDTGIKVTNTQGNAEWFYGIASAWTDINKTPLVAGKTYTISLKAIGTVSQVALRVGIKSATRTTEVTNATNITNGTFSKVTFTFTVPSDTTNIFIRIHGANNNMYTSGFTGNEYFTMKELKLEAGNIATDWTPAPEDIDNTFLKKTNQLPAVARDFNYLAKHMQTYQGTWWNDANPILNAPQNDWIWSSVEVIAGNNENSGVIRTAQLPFGNFHIANVDQGVIKGWKLIANDYSVVHNTGTETIAGDKTFTGKIKGVTKTGSVVASGYRPAMNYAYNDFMVQVTLAGGNAAVPVGTNFVLPSEIPAPAMNITLNLGSGVLLNVQSDRNINVSGTTLPGNFYHTISWVPAN